MPDWKNEKTKLVTSWVINTPDLNQSAHKFTTANLSAPILYRAWLKSEELQEEINTDGILVLDLELPLASSAIFYGH